MDANFAEHKSTTDRKYKHKQSTVFADEISKFSLPTLALQFFLASHLKCPLSLSN